MFWDETFVAIACALCALTTHAEVQRLTVDDVDKLSQQKIVHDLTGDDTKPVAAPQAAAPVPASALAPPAVQKPVRYVAPMTPVTPVTFVGAYRDDQGGSFVLYEFNDAVYTGHVGEKLLNGWTARKVNGFLVTVEEGSGKHPHTWTVPIRSMTPSVSVTVSAPAGPAGSSLQAIQDLGRPLPPGMIGGPGPAMLQGGVQ